MRMPATARPVSGSMSAGRISRPQSTVFMVGAP